MSIALGNIQKSESESRPNMADIFHSILDFPHRLSSFLKSFFFRPPLQQPVERSLFNAMQYIKRKAVCRTFCGPLPRAKC